MSETLDSNLQNKIIENSNQEKEVMATPENINIEVTAVPEKTAMEMSGPLESNIQNKILENTNQIKEAISTPENINIEVTAAPEKLNVEMSGSLDSIVTVSSEQLITIIQALKSTSELAVSEMPPFEISLSSSPDVAAIVLACLSFFIACFVIFVAARSTREDHKSMIISQAKIASEKNELEDKKSKRDMISGSRRVWINSLRDEVSNLLASFQQLRAYSYLQSSKNEAIRIYSQSGKPKTEEVQDVMLKMTNSIPNDIEQKTKYYYKIAEHKSKIQLLLNPEEKLSQDLINAINKFDNNFNEIEENPNTDIEEVISITQSILKKEWDRVKEKTSDHG